METFSIGEVLRNSWGIFKKNWQSYYIVILVVFLINIVPEIITTLMQGNEDWVVLLLVIRLVAWVLSIIITIGIIRVLLNITDGGRAQLGDLFYVVKDIKAILKYLGTGIMIGFFYMGLILPFVLIGGLLGMVAGSNNAPFVWLIGVLLGLVVIIYVSIRLEFWLYEFVDKKVWGFENLRNSWAITKGHVWNLILFSLVLGLINLLGAIALLIGLIVTIPFTMLSMAVLYRKLQSR